MTATVTNVVRIVSLFVLSQTICVTYTVKYDEKIASEMKVVTNYFTIFFSFPGQVFGHFCFLRTNGFDASPSATMAP